MAYKLIAGGAVEGKTAAELVDSIRACSLFPEKDAKSFKEATAKRCMLYSNHRVRAIADGDFIDDLVENGYLRRVR
jgi:hypothetical protein